jgi:hypothetical protein
MSTLLFLVSRITEVFGAIDDNFVTRAIPALTTAGVTNAGWGVFPGRREKGMRSSKNEVGRL